MIVRNCGAALAFGAQRRRRAVPCLAGRSSPVARFSRAHVPAVAIPIENRAAAWRVDPPAFDRRNQELTHAVRLAHPSFPIQS